MKTIDYRFALQRASTIMAVAVLTLTLIAALTGVLLAFYYEPTAGGAYESLKTVSSAVASGTLVRSLHDIAGNLAIVVALLEIVVMFLGRQFRPSWLAAWITGIFYTLAAIGLGWTAMILDWDQIGYWRFKVELGSIEAIPFIGGQIRDVLTGGNGINSLTVQHLYTLHSYVLSVGAVALAVLHIAALVYQEQERRQIRKKLDTMVTPSGEAASSAASSSLQGAAVEGPALSNS